MWVRQLQTTSYFDKRRTSSRWREWNYKEYEDEGFSKMKKGQGKNEQLVPMSPLPTLMLGKFFTIFIEIIHLFIFYESSFGEING